MIATKLKNNGLVAFLLLLILSISYLSYQNAKDYTELKSIFDIEKEELETELNIVIKDYENASINRSNVSLKLRNELHKIIKLKDTIQKLKADDYKLISFYRKRILNLAEQKKTLFSQIDSLNKKNSTLLSINYDVKKALVKTEDQNTELKYKNNYLLQEKKLLKERIATAEIIEISSIKIEAMKKRKSGKYTSTSRSSRTDAFKIGFSLLENKITSPGKKTIYIQITDKDNNIVAPVKEVTLKNKDKIIYSDILKAEYHNKMLSVISFVNVDKDLIKKGTYKINAFVDGIYINSETIKLK